MFELFISRCNKILVDIDNIVQQLLNIKQQEHEIIEKVNRIMCQNGMFQCRKLNKKKRKRKNINSLASATDILSETFERTKNCIYVCSLITSMGDNLHTVSIVNDWIFDANFSKAIQFGRSGLDKCCKYYYEFVKYTTCKHIWMFTPNKIISIK